MRKNFFQVEIAMVKPIFPNSHAFSHGLWQLSVVTPTYQTMPSAYLYIFQPKSKKRKQSYILEWEEEFLTITSARR